MQRKIMGVVGIIAGLGIVIRNLSGNTLASQTGATGITIFGVAFGALMVAAGVYSLVKKPKTKE